MILIQMFQLKNKFNKVINNNFTILSRGFYFLTVKVANVG